MKAIPRIVGLGVAVPEHVMDQADAAQMAVTLTRAAGRREASVGALYRRTGVQRRHAAILESSTNGVAARQQFFMPRASASDLGPGTARRMQLYERRVGALASAASARALRDACVDAGQITHVVSVSCTGFAAPGFDLKIIGALGLRPTVERTHVGFMGCHGALNGLRVACALSAAQNDAVVLLCAAELCSLHFQYASDPQAVVSNALFGDGAAAVVVTRSPAGASSNLTLEASGSMLAPDTADLMSWRVGDHGFEMRLSSRVPDVIGRQLRKWIDPWLAAQGMTRSDVAAWGVHPGGPRILQACAESLELAPDGLDASMHVLRTRGNMSSPTVLFILDELRRRGVAGPVVLLAFGPGLTMEAALLGRTPRPHSPK